MALNSLFIRNLGRVSYSRCLNVQEGIYGGQQNSLAAVAAASIPSSSFYTYKLPIKNSLVLAEHSSPVFTYGYFDSTDMVTGKQLKELSRLGFDTFKLNKREQGLLWHGPGQLTVYPLLNLPNDPITKRDYIFSLEKVIKSVLNQLGLDCKIQNDSILLIANNLKIGDINIFSDFMTKPGFSLNVNPNLKYFEYTNSKDVTSVWDISKDSSITVGEIFPLVVENFGKFFGFSNTLDSNQLYMSKDTQSSQQSQEHLFASSSSSTPTSSQTVNAPLSFYCMTNTPRRGD
ncbi:hypothetical protein CYY_004824 [Polysphondylium violaceum]|uniref:BPL/LPL catalytic domain-containing protein n=1 Tax=Polysphondylium violaceum TaxID=133409 RepID=A0A8J4PW66_9MYCE|nr:hypothetical protein CYY_004824 [Polysphondylium violaceum]